MPLRHNSGMERGQRPQRHVRVINGRATLVNADVTPSPEPQRAARGVRGAIASGVAQMAPDEIHGTVNVYRMKLSQFDPDGTSEGIWEVISHIDPDTGLGSLRVTGDGVSTVQTHTLRVEPGAQITHKAFTSHMDYRGANLTGATIEGEEIAGNVFDGATLDDVEIGTGRSFQQNVKQETHLRDTSFRGASLRNATIRALTLSNVDFTGADLTGMGLWANLSRDGDWAIDVTDSNFHPDMLGSPGAVEDPNHFQSLHRVKYRRYTLDEAAEITGGTVDDLAMHVWAGDIEVRDNETLERVTDKFDAARHHIPQWGLPAT